MISSVHSNTRCAVVPAALLLYVCSEMETKSFIVLPLSLHMDILSVKHQVNVLYV